MDWENAAHLLHSVVVLDVAVVVLGLEAIEALRDLDGLLMQLAFSISSCAAGGGTEGGRSETTLHSPSTRVGKSRSDRISAEQHAHGKGRGRHGGGVTERQEEVERVGKERRKGWRDEGMGMGRRALATTRTIIVQST